MHKNKEDALSPVIAVVLLLSLVCVIASIAAVSVISGSNNLLINEIKDVKVSVEITGGNMKITPVSGNSLSILESYSIVTNLGEYSYYGTTDFEYNSDSTSITIPYTKDITMINVVGHFSDGTSAVVFTGKIQPGSIVVPSNTPTSTPIPTTTPTVTPTSTPTEKYTVTFNSNGGSGTMNSQAFTKDVSFTLNGNSYTKSGSLFWCWNSKSDGTGTTYTDKESVTFSGNIELYAVWKETASSGVIVSGSDNSDGFSTLDAFIAKINAEASGSVAKDNSGNLIIYKPLIIGNEPIRITSGMAGDDKMISISTGWNAEFGSSPSGNVIFEKYPGYTGALLVIDDDITLNSDSRPLVFNGNLDTTSSESLLIVKSGAVLDVNAGGGISFNNNIVTGNGGAISNAGTIDISNNMNIYKCKAVNGGAIYNTGRITVSTYVSITYCEAVNGGAIYNAGNSENSIAFISGTEISHNIAENGGAIYNIGTIKALNANINSNEAKNNGGGIYNTGTLTLSSSGSVYLINNIADSDNNGSGVGGGLYNTGSYSIPDWILNGDHTNGNTPDKIYSAA